MKFVIDSNVIFAALIRKSTTRDIILSDVFDLCAPEQTFGEIAGYGKLIRDKAKLEEKDFLALLMLLQRHVHLVSNEKYRQDLPLAEEIMKDVDVSDSPFLALAMTLNCSIWSNDKHFKKQRKVKAYGTEALIREFIKELPHR